MKISPRFLCPGALALTASLGGCMAGPDYRAPRVETPAAYTELAAGAPGSPPNSVATTRPILVTRWWSTFNDRELDSLIDRAMKSNLTLRQAGSRILQARAQATVMGAGLYPELDLGGGYQNARGSKNVTFPTGAFGFNPASLGGAAAKGRDHARQSNEGGSSGAPGGFAQSPLGGGGLPGVVTNLYQIGFDTSWEIDIFGGVRRGVEAARADLAASVEDRRDALVSLLAEVARDYVGLRGMQRELEIARQNLASQRQTLGLTIDRFNNGFTTQLDVERARAEVDATAATIPSLEASARQQMHTIAVLLDEPPQALIAELSVSAPVPPAPPEVPIGLPSDLLLRRPDIRRAEQQLAAATARVGVATADLFPKFSLTGSFGTDSTKPKYVADWQSRYFAINPAVVWPVFDAGRIRGNIRVQNAAEAQAEMNYEATVLTALKDVENALVAYSQEQARRHELADAVDANRLAVKLANDQYSQGTTDFLTVLDVERSLFSAEDALAQSDEAISADLVALYKALGGGWEVEVKPY